MNTKAMKPFGKTLLADLDGDSNASLILQNDDGNEAVFPLRLFFRDESNFTLLDKRAFGTDGMEVRGHPSGKERR